MVQANITGSAIITKSIAGGVLNIPVIAANVGLLFLESKDLDFGDPHRLKYIDNVVFDLETDGVVPTLAFTLGYRNELSEDVTWSGPMYLDLDNPAVKIRLPEARFWRIRLNDENPYAQWKLSNIEIYGRVCGFWRR